MKKILLIIFSLIITLIIVNTVFARSGCCSHHGGVCGCGCCDGTGLSATCAPYYPECYKTQTPTPSINCPNHAYQSGGLCYCETGYQPSKKENKCLTNDELCYELVGPSKYKVLKTGGSVCDCLGGYEWNIDERRCLKKEIKEVVVPTVEIKDASTFILDKTIKGALKIPGILRECPSTNCKIIRYYAETAIVNLIEVDKSYLWYRVEAKGDYGEKLSGWMHYSLFINDDREKFNKKSFVTSTIIEVSTGITTNTKDNHKEKTSPFKKLFRLIFGN